MSNSGGTQPPDPNDFTTLLLSSQDIPGSGNNLASYVNPDVDELIRQARSVPGCDQAERAELYYQIQQIAHDDVAYDFTFDFASTFSYALDAAITFTFSFAFTIAFAFNSS